MRNHVYVHTHTETGKKIKDGLENKRVVAKARKRAKLDLESVEYQLNGFRPVYKFLDHHGGQKKIKNPHLAKNVTVRFRQLSILVALFLDRDKQAASEENESNRP